METRADKLKLDGYSYVTCYAASIVSTSYLLLRIKGRPSGFATLNFVFEAQGSLLVNFEIDTFVSPGTEITPVNLNLNSTRAAEHRIFHTPTGTGSPDRIIPSVGTDTGRGIFFAQQKKFECGGFLMNPNVEYLLSCQNISGGLAVIGCSTYITELP